MQQIWSAKSSRINLIVPLKTETNHNIEVQVDEPMIADRCSSTKDGSNYPYPKIYRRRLNRERLPNKPQTVVMAKRANKANKQFTSQYYDFFNHRKVHPEWTPVGFFDKKEQEEKSKFLPSLNYWPGFKQPKCRSKRHHTKV